MLNTILSNTNDISSRINIGPPTKNNESGSGGEINAPNKSAANHKTLLFSKIVSLLTNFTLISNIVTKGIWKPIIEEKYSPVMKVIHDFKRQVEDNPEDVASRR